MTEWLSKLRDHYTVWRLGSIDDTKGGLHWTSWWILIAALAVFGLIANRLVWATIEGFGR